MNMRLFDNALLWHYHLLFFLFDEYDFSYFEFYIQFDENKLKMANVCNMESRKFKDDAGIIKYIQHLHISLL